MARTLSPVAPQQGVLFGEKGDNRWLLNFKSVPWGGLARDATDRQPPILRVRGLRGQESRGDRLVGICPLAVSGCLTEERLGRALARDRVR